MLHAEETPFHPSPYPFPGIPDKEMIVMQKTASLPKKHKEKFLYRDNTVGYIFAAPFIISFCLLTMVPMCLSLYYSFCSYKIGSSPEWLGL